MLKGRHWLSQNVGFALTTAQEVDLSLVLWLKYGRVQGERNDDHDSGGISK